MIYKIVTVEHRGESGNHKMDVCHAKDWRKKTPLLEKKWGGGNQLFFNRTQEKDGKGRGAESTNQVRLNNAAEKA